MTAGDSTVYGVIYKITNTANNKIYIGQTTQGIERRFLQHCELQGKCRVLENAIKKYGKEFFTVEQIGHAFSLDELNAKEREQIEAHECIAPKGYNLCSGGGQGGKLHEDTKRKLSESAKTPERREFLKNLLARDDVRKKLSDAGKRNWEACKDRVRGGVTAESLLRAKESVIRTWRDPEMRAKRSALIRIMYEDQSFIDEKRKGMIRAWASITEEQRKQRGETLSKALKGHKKKIDKSPEAKASRSDVRRKLWADDEYKAKQLEAMQSPDVRKKRGDAIRAGWERRRQRLLEESQQAI